MSDDQSRSLQSLSSTAAAEGQLAAETHLASGGRKPPGEGNAIDAEPAADVSDPYRTISVPDAQTASEEHITPSEGIPSEDLPRTFGRHRVTKKLGEGGFGVVYRGFDDELRRDVAIKVPRRERIASPADAEAYLTEARVLASLDHPGIVPVYDLGRTDDGLCYVVSKFVPGGDLARSIAAHRPGRAKAAELTAWVAEALHYAHQHGLVHRDVKPGNILLDEVGRPLVADFGLALAEESFGRGPGYCGTPAYMSPEQARGEGHRVDARSDIYSLGVVLYELLTGKRPYRAQRAAELLDEIASGDTRPPRQLDDTVPRELERICMKSLAKRTCDRYGTALDLAEDLRHWHARASGGRKPPVGAEEFPGRDDKESEGVERQSHAGAPTGGRRTPDAGIPAQPVVRAPIVPKGLRSFDAHDSDFFLELLPGPRDREGLPDSIRFWKTRVEATDPDDTFSLGLIYGPSGCGKSSLVKAGLLPRLAPHVRAVYIEASADDTETRLVKGLRKVHDASVPPSEPIAIQAGGTPRSELVELLTALRRGDGLAPGQKVLIVLDQFEQWLHANQDKERSELVQALRHCDGGRTQCLVMVRDDFWMAVTRFLGDVEVELAQGGNFAAIDLFPAHHARKVLAAFGAAFGVLGDPGGNRTPDEEAFLDRAVAGLADGGKVICVRLALFAEMIKGKPWTSASLKQVGGAAGIGVTFLEETFSAPTANPKHRLHQRAARGVLKALLPESGGDIKGRMRSRDELLTASGYAARPRDFDELLRILDAELRLITPADEEPSSEPSPFRNPKSEIRNYQLTHDYLVPSLSDWLTGKQRETRRGRAELRLAERAVFWTAKPEDRHLPSWWEYLTIVGLTKRPTWTGPQRRMLRRAGRLHATRAAALAAALTLLTWGGNELNGRYQARGIVLSLQAADADDMDPLLRQLGPYRRWAAPDLAAMATSYDNLASNLSAQGKYAEALPLYKKALDLNRELLGETHRDTATSYNNLADNLNALAKYAEAVPLYERALELRRDLFGQNHLDTAVSYNSLAGNLNDQGKYAEALPLFEKALELRRELLGEKHPDTATSYNNLARNLKSLGKYAEAQVLFQKAFDLRLELLGENHPDSATSYDNVAANLDAQGKYADAQPLKEKALELHRQLLGDDHPDTAQSYSTLALNLQHQGKYTEAQQLYQRALELNHELLGEKHPVTATSYDNLAANLNAQGKYVQAQPLCERALDLRLELLGDDHPDTATSYDNLASNMNDQGKYADADALYQKALEIRRRLLGDDHPDTATSYENVAANLDDQGKYADAEPLYQKALDVRRELLGENHPETAGNYSSLAYTLVSRRKYTSALPLLAKATAAFEAARLGVADRGFERAVYGAKRSPYPLLAATQAQLDNPAAAWVAAESDLARGLSDETAARHRVTLTAEEDDRKVALAIRLSQLQPAILRLVSKHSPSDGVNGELAQLQRERRALENQLAELAVALSQREVAPLGEVQAAIAADAALVLWVDVRDRSGRLQEHWGCVVRENGDPMWERLPGTGPEPTWTGDDGAVSRALTEAVIGAASSAEIAALAGKLYAQRIAPLEQHLDGVGRLFVVPINAMAGVPVDVLTDKFTISYVPSGTFLARLKDRPAPSASSMLVLGDPDFSSVEPAGELPLPPGGLLITQVLPGGNAAQVGLRPGDVLLKYAEAQLTSVELLGKLIEEHAQDKSISSTVWRDGESTDRYMPPGRLGAVFDQQPAPEAISAKRRMDQLLELARGGGWADLPGCAFEVARLTKLLGDKQTTLLTRSMASEQELERLRADGKLAGYRYLHFATHCEPNNTRSFESALILAQNHVSEEIPPGGGKYYDGKLTASEVIETWELNADLVTLSACESALGRPGGGDGLLGFAQAFLLAGSRAVCLSLWKVDDTATALLMDRFYQNLLGMRAGVVKPIPKAAALAEAKQWLRGLSADDAANAAADISLGKTRGKSRKVLPLKDPQDAGHPFSHPRYWAAFVLIGDPN